MPAPLAPRPRVRPRLPVARVLARTAAEAALAPLQLLAHLPSMDRLRAGVRADLDTVEVPREPPSVAPTEQPLHVFVSCAEASGEAHAANLVAALRARLAAAGAPAPRFSGLGGARLAQAGVDVVADPVSRAAMGFGAVLRALPFYVELLGRAAERLGGDPPDLCVGVDSPALHVPLGRLAHLHGVPCAHLVAPQYWGWAPWRVRAYRDAVDRALTILPFEPAWFRRHGVEPVHVGHPHLDALAGVPPPDPSPSARRGLALLPGSRAGVVARNLPWMLAAAARLRERAGELSVVVPHARADLGPALRAAVNAAGAETWARVELGDLHRTLAGVRAALSVSGTVLLDVVHQRLPAVVVYRLRGRASAALYRSLLTTPWFASPNLLAGEELLPEFGFWGEGPVEDVSRALERCYNDDTWRAACVAGLDRVRERLGPPGAVDRAAGWLLAWLAAGAPR